MMRLQLSLKSIFSNSWPTQGKLLSISVGVTVHKRIAFAFTGTHLPLASSCGIINMSSICGWNVVRLVTAEQINSVHASNRVIAHPHHVSAPAPGQTSLKCFCWMYMSSPIPDLRQQLPLKMWKLLWDGQLKTSWWVLQNQKKVFS